MTEEYPAIPLEVDAPGAVLVRREVVKWDDTDIKKGLIHGQVVPYEERVELIPDVFEEFAPETFTRQAAVPDSWARVKLLFGHDDGQVPLGRMTQMAETRSGCEATFQANMRLMTETERGREVWTSLEAGDLDEFSVGFTAARGKAGTQITRLGGGQVLLRRLRAHLSHVGLVPYGAYGRGAMVASVRNEGTAPVDAWADWRAKIDLLRSVP